MSRLPWALKHRPANVKEFIFQDQQTKELVERYIAEEHFPNLLLTGHRGTGKTSLALMLKRQLGIDDMDFLALNASDDNSIDTIRTKVKSFIGTFSMSAFKIVFLDEADFMTPNAQAALRGMMENEEYAKNARFILTGNKAHKIVPELRESRLTEIVFKSPDREAMLLRAVKILKKEGVEVDEPAMELVEKYIDSCYPDFRKLLNRLERQSVNGKLTDSDSNESVSEFLVDLMDMIEKNQWGKIRGYMAENTPDDQWEEAYRFLYDYIGEVVAFNAADKHDQAIIVIADHLYKHAIVADPEINFAACIVKLSKIAK